MGPSSNDEGASHVTPFNAMVSSHARKDGLYDVPLAGDVTASPEESLLAADVNVFHLAAGESLAMARRKKRNLKFPVFVYDRNVVSAKSLALKRKIEGVELGNDEARKRIVLGAVSNFSISAEVAAQPR